MKAWLALGILVARAAAAAPGPARCEAGARFAEHGDLPRAALYLDGCEDQAAYARTARDVRTKLEHSALSTLDIETTPPGLIAEVDALPGEHLTTPATVWVRAGHHVVHVAREGGPPLVATVDVAPHAHAAVVLELPKPPPPPHAGHVSFEEENAGEVQPAGPPPAVKHPPMLDCKYTRSCAAAGPRLEDPLAVHVAAAPPYPREWIELRGGAGDYTKGFAPSLAIVFRAKLPWQAHRAEHPWVWGGHLDWSRQAGANDIGGTLELLKVISALDTAWILPGLGLRNSSYYGLEATATLELALRRLPVSISAQYEQGLSESATRALVFELGARWAPY